MAGYKDLLVYRLAVTIFDLTDLFCRRWIEKRSRTFDQMVQASRSGKQNIAEASKEISSSSQILLNSTSRASYTELGEDFEDFLRQRNLPIWSKNDPRILKIRVFRESVESPTNLANLTSWTNLNFENQENFANLMLCLCFKQGYLMDQLLRSLEGKFVKEGGFRENLFRKRREYRQQI
ncbi:four helix bundle protein [Candidatus Shapirobacteria bacterium CG09_land_8_20_14_0_10_47_13]|uniref:Four helix bundle protein n=1 Tax=Candidatus Shapirobacteria bacterium CG09_land_8_20_14_0_10_47_13 TaxID=1974481 RepID=A0A2H0WMW9_9BACT|nr:MAG: four helix bundle protein [Candidatus Shapirobacteria bacterium CG09_land_8_20_14_0_10_47_13]